VGTGLANTNYIKFGADTRFAKDFGAQAYMYWLHASKEVAINTFMDGLPTEPSRQLGWELDGKVSYNIAKNLTYWVEGGYMWTGKAYDWSDGHADNMYAVRHGLQLNF